MQCSSFKSYQFMVVSLDNKQFKLSFHNGNRLGTDHLTWRGGVMVFCFVQKFFFGQHKSWNIYFFCRAKCEFFFKNLTLGYMTKTLNQIIIFFLHQNQNIFFSNIGNQNIFLEKKNITPPFKLNDRSLTTISFVSKP